MSTRDAARRWLDGLHEIPASIVEKLKKLWELEYDVTDTFTGECFKKITTLFVGQWVSVYDDCYGYIGGGEILAINEGDDYNYPAVTVRLDSGETITVERGQINCEADQWPMWGTMWAFKSEDDRRWLEEGDGLEQLARCGFMVFEQEDYGYVFGINGWGYDFFEWHWLPLYKARHKKERKVG